jgi:hypothetical protein
MGTEEDAEELFTNISGELDTISEESYQSMSKGSSTYWLKCDVGTYYLTKDSSVVIYGTGFEDDWAELRYLMYKLGYYKYDTTYIKNQKEVAEQTFGY